MVIARCSRRPICWGSCCGRLLSICRVVVLVVVVLAVVLALRGYPPKAITGPVLVLVGGAVAAVDRLVGVGRRRRVLALLAS
jgi:hypothetical protein